MNNTVVDKYKNVVIEGIEHPVFTTMVQITKTPKNKGELLHKKYVSRDKAIIAIDKLVAENLIASGGRKAKEDMIELGILVESEADIVLAMQGEEEA
jgi:hypothetical protein